MPTHSKPPPLTGGGSFYALKFSLYLFLLIIPAYFMPDGIDSSLMKATANGAVALAGLIGFDAMMEPTGVIIWIEGMRLSIVSECTALVYIIIFAAAVLSYPATIRRKSFGLIIGISTIVLINLVRIILLGWVGGHYPSYFNILHYYIWEGGFLLLVLLLWMAWVNYPFSVRWKGWLKGAVTLAMTIGLLITLSGWYIRMISSMSDSLIVRLGLYGGLIRSDGDEVFLLIWGRMPYKSPIGVYYFLPFIILTLFFPNSRFDQGRKATAIETSLRLITGAATLFLLHIAALAISFSAALKGEGWKVTAVYAAVAASPVIIWYLQSMVSMQIRKKCS